MTVYWVRFNGDSAAAAMQAIARALATNERGEAPDAPAAPVAPNEAQTSVERDAYLQANLAAIRAGWSIDPFQSVAIGPPRVDRLLQPIQRLTRRATWWYVLPPWLQANEFHAALVRTIESMLEYTRQSQVRQQQVDEELRQLHMKIQVLQRQLLEAQQALYERRNEDGTLS